ncbi:Ig-like domain-containing protein, partial [Pseudomonas sp. PDM22]|uniref:Ig-like domain-containing protein n=2 Tax=Pseudomonas sp. PDM22 TaxID=2769287 RepID=UPI001784FD99
MAIETIGLVAVTENAAKKLAVKTGGKIKAHAGTKYLLQVENSDVAPENVTVKRVGKDLLVQFEGSEKPDLTIQDFFAEGMDSQLYGVAEDGQLYAYVRTDGETFGDSQLLLADGDTAPIALGGDSLGNGAAYLASTFDDAAGFVLWPWLLGLAGVGAAAAAIIHHNKDNGGHHHGPETSPAPTNNKATDNVGPTQGELHNGDVTDDKSPVISGDGVPGAIIHVIDNGTEIGSTVVKPDGTWDFKPDLPDGPHEIDVTQEVPGEKPSEPVHVIDIVVDTVAPEAPFVELDPASDSGIQGDNITNDTTPTIDGKTEPGADVVVIFPTGEEIHAKADENGEWSVTPTQPLPEGNNDITVIATDPAGNTSEPTVITVVIDTTAPSADAWLDPASDSGTKGDGITNDTTPTIDGKTEPNSDVTVTFPTGEEIHAKADENGDWSVTPTQPLPEGDNQITIVVTDPAGNQSEPAVLPIVIDTSIDKPDAWLDPASDSGTKGDNITNDTTPTIDGNTEPGADVVVIFPTGEEIHAKADENGDWSVTPTQPLPEGNNDITVIATDPAGNQSEPTVISVVIDSTAPSAPTIDSIVDNDDPSNLIDIPKDGSTNDTTPVISGGGAEPGDIIHVFDGGKELGSTTAKDDGTWSFEVPADKALPEGEHDFTVKAEDPAGNISEPSQPYPIVIDTTAPTAPVIKDVVDNDDPSNLIDVPKNGSTNDTTPVISGDGAEKGDIIHVFDGGKELGSTTAKDDGTWSFEVPPDKALAEGEHDFTVKAEDPAGNISDPSQPYPIVIDTTAPTAPVIKDVVDNDDPSNLIDVPKNGSTNDTTPVISGDGAEKGDIIHVFDGGKELGSTTAKDDGTWSFEVPADKALAEGEHDFTVKAEDPAGNISDASQPYPIVIDTTAPTAPVIKDVVDNDDPSNLIDVPKNGSTNDTTPVISGDGAEKGDIIHVFDGETELGTAIAGEDGKWSFEVPADKALDEGEHDFTVKAEDPAGNISDPSQPYPIVIDTTAPTAPVIKDVVDNDDPSNLIDVPKNGSTNDTTPVITGDGAEKGDIIHVFDGGKELGSTTAKDDGTWSFEVPADKALAEGEHDFTVKAEDPAGNISDASQPYPIVIDTTAPTAPVIKDVVDNDDPSNLIDVPKNGSTNDTTPVITGDGAEKGDIIHVFDGGKELGSTTAKDDGTWSFEVPADKALAEGEHDFTVKAEDPAGNISDASQPYPIVIDTTAPDDKTTQLTIDTVAGDDVLNAAEADVQQTISGKASGEFQKGDVVSFTLNGTEYSAKVAADGSWSVQVAGSDLAKETNIHATLVAHDAAGNAGEITADHGYTVSIVPGSVTLAIDVVAGDDVVNFAESQVQQTINGKAVGEFTAGDVVSFKLNGTDYSAKVAADGSWSVKVAGADLAAETNIH